MAAHGGIVVDAGVVDQYLDRACIEQSFEGRTRRIPVGHVERNDLRRAAGRTQLDGECAGRIVVLIGMYHDVQTTAGEPATDCRTQDTAPARDQGALHASPSLFGRLARLRLGPTRPVRTRPISIEPPARRTGSGLVPPVHDTALQIWLNREIPRRSKNLDGHHGDASAGQRLPAGTGAEFVDTTVDQAPAIQVETGADLVQPCHFQPYLAHGGEESGCR